MRKIRVEAAVLAELPVQEELVASPVRPLAED